MSTTLGDLLYGTGTGQGRQAALTGAIDRAGISLSTAGLSATSGDVAGALVRLLDLPIGNLAIRGWSKHRDVERARAETRATPGEREVVQLAQHRITSEQSPTVDLSVAGVHTTVLVLDLEVVIDVGLVAVVVEGGEIVETVPGPSKASAKLSASDVVLAQRELTLIDLREPAVPAAPVATPV